MKSAGKQSIKSSARIPMGRFTSINGLLHANSELDSDPEALETYVPSSDSDSERDSDDEAFTGREHYEAVGYGTCKLVCLGHLLTRF
jgi:hypothetical protein